MSVPVWLIVTLCTVAVDVRLGVVLVRLSVKIPSCQISPSVAAILKYDWGTLPTELRDQ